MRSASPGPTSKLRVYLVEDEEDLREALVYSLNQLNFEVTGFGDSASFYRAFAVARSDVVVLDIGLPGEDGLSMAAHLRSASDVGIILATARGAVTDRIQGMRSGADAYLIKPLHPEELAATLEAVGRRLRPVHPPPAAAAPSAPPAKTNGKWHLTEGNWFLCDPQGQMLRLTTSERTVMTCLFKERDKPINREQLAKALGGDLAEFDLQRIDAIISRLRRKALAAGMMLPLHAVRGTGYEFHI